MGEPVGAASAGPVIRNEDSIGTNGLHDHGANGQIVAASGDRDPVAVLDSMLLGQPRMNFSPRLRILVHQCADAAGLGARKILADHAARGQKKGYSSSTGSPLGRHSVTLKWALPSWV